MSDIWSYDGRSKEKLKSGGKVYIARFSRLATGTVRCSRKLHKTATKAETYGAEVVARLARLQAKAAESARAT